MLNPPALPASLLGQGGSAGAAAFGPNATYANVGRPEAGNVGGGGSRTDPTFFSAGGGGGGGGGGSGTSSSRSSGICECVIACIELSYQL